MPHTDFDPVGSFQRGRSNALAIQQQEQQIAQQPLRNELAGLQVQQAQQAVGTGAIAQTQQRSVLMNQVSKALLGLPESQWQQAIPLINQQIEGSGLPPIDPATATREKFQQVADVTQEFIADPERATAFQKGQTFQVQTPEGPAIATNVFDPTTGGQRLEITPLGPGVVPTSRIGETPTQRQIREVMTEIQKTSAKAGIKLRTEPSIQAAVIQAVSEVKSTQKAIGDQRSNQTALDTYKTAMKGLVDSLAGTDTGPFIGLLPALTANQQIADGATAAMSPILKDLFRTAGEGTFTDKDQELLTKMVPTRTDLPAARRSKIQNIDAIIRAKLSQPQEVPAQPSAQTTPAPAAAPITPAEVQAVQQPAAPARRIRFDAQGNIVQ